MNTLSVKKNIYSLENPVWLRNAGMSKGIGHDRQHLSIILPANSDLQIRQINESFDVKLKLRLLNNDSKTEKTVSVLHEWVTVNTTVASVPFIDTPYINNGSDKQQTPIIEYRYPENSKILPIYRKFDNESDFLNFCKQQDSEFFLIDTEYFLMLVPQHDQETLIDIKNTIGMNRLINHYEKVISFYNELSGISFNPKQITNKNIPNRFFIKADQHGNGAAYYSSLWTAENNSSITKLWLQDLENKWGHLHAIAHGYEGKFMSNTGLDVNEIWNNIYAASYQDVYLGDKVFECGWLYSNTNELFSFINNYLENNIPVNNWNLKSKLYFMMLMKDRAGNASFVNFNQKFRRFCNNKNVNLYDINLLDMLANNYSKNGKIDVIPFIQMVRGKLSTHQRMINHIYHESSVYPLCMLINQDKLSSMQYKLKLKTPFDLVNAIQLRSTGLTGNLQFEIEIDSFKEIYGEEMFLMEGQNHFLKTKITQPEFILSDIPIGSYTLKLPTGKSTKYNIDKMYAIVKEGDNQLEINYLKKTSSRLLDKKINFLGIRNKKFATLIIDFVEKSIILNVTDNNPHSYFDDNKYFGITIKSSDGIQLFSKELKGNNLDNKIGQDKIKFNYEDKIELFHAESKKIITDYGNFLTNKKDHYLIIKSNGLYNQETQNDIEEELIKRIEDGANFIKKINRL